VMGDYANNTFQKYFSTIATILIVIASVSTIIIAIIGS